VLASSGSKQTKRPNFSTTSRGITMNLRYMSHFKVTLMLVNDLIIMPITQEFVFCDYI
jgi:hypothetical protein